ncbi:MAG: alanine racemase, partial [Coriobacteriia bacterium]|nr:alanine racemase [Coriobacteriia bacterium]
HKADLIHSVSSFKLAQDINKRAAREEIKQAVLLEVNVSGEESKSGFSVQEVSSLMDELQELSYLDIQGFMTMAPQGDEELARKTFEGLRMLRDKLAEESGLALRELSMGMSEDFCPAIEEGASIIRLGRSIFDPNFIS